MYSDDDNDEEVDGDAEEDYDDEEMGETQQG